MVMKAALAGGALIVACVLFAFARGKKQTKIV
jgi:hypothetical protein